MNANEPVGPPDFPVFMGRDTFGDWRARRIRELLEQVGPAYRRRTSPRMQTDVVDTFARQVLPTLLAVPDVTGARRHGAGAAARLGRVRDDGFARSR